MFGIFNFSKSISAILSGKLFGRHYSRLRAEVTASDFFVPGTNSAPAVRARLPSCITCWRF